MSEQIIQVNEAPKWARLLAAGLFGWLVFLFGSFLMMIAMSALFNAAGMTITLGSGLFIVEVAVTLLVSVVVCYYLTRKAYGWYSKMKPVTLYITLAALSCIAVLSFPAPFMFTEISSGH
jgi:chromate transport protein ChrA